MNKKKKNFKKPSISQEYNNKLLSFSNKNIEKIYEEFNSNEKGLSLNQVEINEEKFGVNNVTSKKQHHWYNIFLSAFFTPFSIVLVVIALLNILIPNSQGIISPSLENWVCFSIIVTLIVISGSIKMFQELRSWNASEKLQAMIRTTTAIERDNIKKEIPFNNVVVGDIVHLAAGDMIPADLKIISAKDLFISQSSLTGESEPVEKFAINKTNASTALECDNLCFMGTTVSSGTAKGIIISTGSNTFFGKVAKSIASKKPKTNFDKGIKSVSWLLIFTMLIMTIIVFILRGTLNVSVETNPWIAALMFSLAIAVGITPEMLPMIVTLNLAKEAFKLSKQKTIVKNINSIQSFGAMDVLCTDKTGTLTEDRIVLERHINLDGKEDNRVLVFGFLNSYYQTGLKNLLDLAIIDKAENIGINNSILEFKKIDEIPFDFSRRRMSVVLSDKANEIQLITKGAIEEIMSVCSFAEYNGSVCELNTELKDKIRKTVDELCSQGMRVIAVATNNERLEKNNNFSIKDESNMRLIGYIALLDPPKMSAKNAIQALQTRGTEVKVLTGDTDSIAKYICKKVGIESKNVLLGQDIEKMSDEELKTKVMAINIFAKLSPEQKARVVLAIKANKHIVGFMGDGINDASAMRVADIAISVDTAVDIAKECADIVLLEKNLMVLESGIIEGRKTFANIIKYIKMTVSSNFGNILSILIASIWLRFEPITAIQILILNMISDFSQFAIPWDNVDEEYLMRPQNWNAKTILKFMLFIGPVSSIFDITAFLIMYYGLGWNNPEHYDLFRTGWFLVSLLTQMSVILVLRTSKIPLLQSRPSAPIALSILCLIMIGLLFVLIPNLGALGFISLTYFPQMIGYALLIVIGYCITSQFWKMCYIKMFHEWL